VCVCVCVCVEAGLGVEMGVLLSRSLRDGRVEKLEEDVRAIDALCGSEGERDQQANKS
jgi:hypothetical protein